MRRPFQFLKQIVSRPPGTESPNIMDAVPDGSDPVVVLPLAYKVPELKSIPSVAVLFHAYYVDELAEFQRFLANIPFPFALFISTDSPTKKAAIEQSFSTWNRGVVEVHVFPNRGRDIAPKFVGFREVHERYDYVLHLHTKKSPHVAELERWRPLILESLLGSREIVAGIFELFANLPHLGVIAPRTFESIRPWVAWGGNLNKCAVLARRMGIRLSPSSRVDCAMGSMFWARAPALKPMLDLKLAFGDFEQELGQLDGSLAHALERMTFYSAEIAGYACIHAGSEENPAPFEKMLRVHSRAELEEVISSASSRLLAQGKASNLRPIRPHSRAMDFK